jgi:hypothetical protein
MSLLIDPNDFDAAYQERNAADIRREAEAEQAILDMADKYGDAIRLLWNRGNGTGGGIMQMLADRLGLATSYGRQPAAYRKAKINGDLRRAVFERDAYRCVACAGFRDLTCDHRVPESKGGPTTLDNLQTMCRPCNSSKGARND